MEEILKGSPSNAKLWWKAVSVGEVLVQPNFNWHLFTSEVVANAYRHAKGNDEKSCLEWAELAIILEEFLAASSDEEVVAHACEMTAMQLRATLISKFGHVAGHLVLDSNAIIKWFFDRLTISLTEMIEGEKHWWKISDKERVARLKTDAAENLQIMYAKNRPCVIKVLENCQSGFVTAGLREWLVANAELGEWFVANVLNKKS